MKGFGSYHHWTTQDELTFLQGLGTFCSDEHIALGDGVLGKARRKALLVKYLETMPQRESWGDRVNPAQVKKAVTKMIAAIP
jgi:hypothetical protein